MTETPNQQDLDGSDLLDTLEIIKIERRHLSTGGAWVTGTMGEHRFEALVFPEHAENPDYEIDDSRISKLWLQRIEDRATVYNWDRGADIEPATPIAAKIVGLLAAGLAEHIYAK
jgi:hypothetical protein